MQLQPRDFQILTALELWGILGLGQIKASFFRAHPNELGSLLFNEYARAHGSAFDRLQRLAAAHYVRVHRFIGQKQVYGLADRGHARLKEKALDRLPTFMERVSARTVHHHLLVSGVGLLISRIFRLPVMTERQMYVVRTKNRAGRLGTFHIPDLLVEAPSGQKIIEVELNLKSRERYRELWTFYKGNLPRNAGLFYLLPDRRRVASLLELSGKFNADFLFACDLPSFRESLGQSRFVNSKGETRRLA